MMIILPTNPDKQTKMAEYMRNKFIFNGVDATQRHALEKEAWQEIRTLSADEMFEVIKSYYEKEAREYQYLAIDLAVRAQRKWNQEYLLKFLELAKTKMWWDSIDAWRKLYGEYGKLHPEEFNWLSELFINHEIFWMRRIGINLQLGYKERTNTDYLSQMIANDLNTDEFFIQKAIGWSLRDYLKYDQDWVLNFLDNHQLSDLAQREATKHLKQYKKAM